jgi:hypothetical protein
MLEKIVVNFIVMFMEFQQLLLDFLMYMGRVNLKKVIIQRL